MTGNGTAGPYFLTGRPLLSDILKISGREGMLRSDLSYSLYANPGRMVFSRAIPAGDTIIVLFSALPFSLRSTYEAARHTRAAIVPPASTTAPHPRAGSAHRVPAPFKLEISGAKTFGITVGSKNDVRTEQGLQLAVNGQLTETVKLTAAISDRFSHRLSSGATASRLNDLDDFFIAVKSPGFGARLGELLIDPSRKSALTPRRLSGAEASLSFGGHQFYTAAGRLAGIARRVEFFAAAGRQGPYALTAGRRAVVPHSETVYLDGRRLEHGAGRDYTVDYFTGEITFTPRVVLAENRRVTVDFEESVHTYLRRAAFASWYTQSLGGRLANRLDLQWEGDDPDAGIGFNLLPEDRDTLRRSTDDQLLRDGAEYVGAGRGEYIAVDGDSGVIYEYVGPENGDYDVRFEYVGAGKGSYVHLGGGAFGYLGDMHGDFVPQITVSAPSSRMLFTDDLRFSRTLIGIVNLTLSGQVFQPNRLNRTSRRADWAHDVLWSSADGVDHDLAAQRVRATARWRRLGDFAKADFEVPVDDIAREWYLPTGRLPTDVDVFESSAEFSFDPRLRFAIEGGRLTGSFSGWRDAERIELDITPAVSSRFSHRRSKAVPGAREAQRSREVWSLGQTLRHGWWELFTGLRREDRRVAFNRGDRIEGYELGFGFWQLQLTLAGDRVYDVVGSPTLTEKRRRVALDGSWAVSPLGITGSLSATRASRRRLSNNRLYRDYLGRADLRWSWPKLGLAASLNYSLNRIGTRCPIESFIPVAEGFGDYRRADSMFVPDPTGDFTRVTGSMGELQPAAAGQKEFILRRSYGSGRTGGLRLLEHFSAELHLARRERIDPEHISIFGWMLPWGKLKAKGAGVDYTLLQQETSASVERRFPSGSGFWFMRGRYHQRGHRYGAASSTGENLRRTWEISVRGNLRGSTWKNWEVLLARHERNTAGYIGAINVLSHRGQAIASCHLSARGYASMKSSLEYLHDRAGRGRARVYGLSPSMTFRFGPRAGRGSLKSGVEYYFAESVLPGMFVPGFGGIYSPGHNARFLLEGQLEISGSVSVNLRSSMDYSGKRRPLYRLNLRATSKF